MSIPIGQHLRAVRKAKGLTLQQLASRTGFSIGYLSNIERDLVSPTVSVLSDICSALNVDMTTFLQPLSPKTPVFKKSAREMVYSSDAARIKYESITPNGFPLKGLCVTISPGGTSSGMTGEEVKMHTHTSDELGIVIQGTLELTIGEDTYFLEEGDTFCIESGIPHWYKNAGDTVSIHYSINT
jgi:quercetin dioxygenase-like cupin family protein